MSKIVFSLTDRQVDVLARVYAAADLTWRDRETLNRLEARGLVKGEHYSSMRLTPLGKLSAPLAVALAPAEQQKK